MDADAKKHAKLKFELFMAKSLTLRTIFKKLHNVSKNNIDKVELSVKFYKKSRNRILLSCKIFSEKQN